jgi:hypothetical protein
MTNPSDPHQQPQGGFPPAAPPVSEAEYGQQVVRPKSVDTAYMLWLVAAGIGIVTNLIGLITAQAIADATARSLGVDPALVAGSGPSYGGIIFQLLLSVLWIVVVLQMRKGANWARIVLTVLGGLGILFGLMGLAALGILFAVGVFGAIQAVLGLVALVVEIAAIVFMFKSDSNRYFKANG